MPELTPAYIATEERRTAEHYEDLAMKARKGGDTVAATDYDVLATMARNQAGRVERGTQAPLIE